MAGKEEKEAFYGDAEKYWKTIPATVDGMLGGFSFISSTDIKGSSKFIKEFIKGKKARTGTTRVLDCGAGIGRITKRLLLPLFQNVDMVEMNQAFLDEAKPYLGEDASRVERFICSGLQDFTPESGRYDVIWSQWVLGHLTDEHLLAFFQRCKSGLCENGIFVIKENISPTEEVLFDEKDSSYARPKSLLLELIRKSGLKVLKMEKQKHFPKNIYDVWMFAME